MKTFKLDICQGNRSECGKEPSEEHGCPYQEEINEDYDFKCNCCDSCRQECSYDI